MHKNADPRVGRASNSADQFRQAFSDRYLSDGFHRLLFSLFLPPDTEKMGFSPASIYRCTPILPPCCVQRSRDSLQRTLLNSEKTSDSTSSFVVSRLPRLYALLLTLYVLTGISLLFVVAHWAFSRFSPLTFFLLDKLGLEFFNGSITALAAGTSPSLSSSMSHTDLFLPFHFFSQPFSCAAQIDSTRATPSRRLELRPVSTSRRNASEPS